MVRLLKILLASLFISVSAQAVYLPGMSPGDVMVGGKLLSGAGLIVLHFENEGGSGTGTTAYKGTSSSGAPAAYVVPAAKEFIMHAIKCNLVNASSTSVLPQRVVYGDTAILNASVVNPVGMVSGVGSGGSLQDTIFGPQIAAGDSSTKEVAMYGRVPTGKYPTIYNNTSGYISVCTMYGYEI